MEIDYMIPKMWFMGGVPPSYGVRKFMGGVPPLYQPCAPSRFGVPLVPRASDSGTPRKKTGVPEFCGLFVSSHIGSADVTYLYIVYI